VELSQAYKCTCFCTGLNTVSSLSNPGALPYKNDGGACGTLTVGARGFFSFCGSRRSRAGTARPESLRTKSNVRLEPLSNRAHRLFHRRYLENGPLEPW